MVLDGERTSLVNNSPIKLEDDHQNPNYLDAQVVQRSDKEKNFVEMEGRGYSDFLRNSSEEMFLKSLIESSIGMPTPTMEMLGFKNLTQNFRADSEELFNSWLNNGEASSHRTRQASRRISTELAALVSQQHGSNDILFPQTLSMVDELSSDDNQRPLRNVVEKGMQASNMYLAKAWFHSSHPMTRSRSSELRKRYAAMQNFQTTNGMESTQNASEHGISRMKQEFATTSSFGDISEIPNQSRTFMSPSNSSTSPFSNPPIATVDAVSSVVSMLKGTLERKKLNNQIERETIEGSQFRFYGAQEVVPHMSLDQGQLNHILEPQATYQAVSAVQLKDSEKLQTNEGSIEIDIDGFVAPANPIQMSTVSQEPSQSESSAAAPVHSTGFEVCDGPTNSGQTPSGCESSMKQVGNGGLENGSRAKEFRERIFENNLKDDRKKVCGLISFSLTNRSYAVDKGDPTKKRRVERSRKMAEAKERNLTPATPSDMQSILKRCENLEKEVRSLKLNLSFMNRKDSEQTKQIEELQKQNEELADEKERLLEEIERILSGKM
ncbi:hypothetical protein BVC80_1833g114 [Macleaya cordata]|uniref:Protein CYCLOPS n=1 Tax=Macleaya cordata TaxID=56857 RepID=A0A200R6T0_MACCD|nr:hypothetical protein BVC80_1833g114 [Macleaya cordata]